MRIVRSWRKIGRPSVVEERRNVKVNAKKPSLDWRSVVFKKIVPKRIPAMVDWISLAVKSWLVLRMLLKNLSPRMVVSFR